MRATNNKATSSTAQEPLYKVVRREILNCLASGEWKIGDQLPNEADLSRRFGVGISTLRAGIGQLVATGVLTRRQGRGTFVAPHSESSRYLRFSNIYAQDGAKLSTTRRITSMRKVRGEPDVRRALGLSDDIGGVWHIEGELSADGSVVSIIELFLPVHLFSSLRRSDLQQASQNLYAIYQQVCDVTVLRMEERVFARLAGKHAATVLGIKPGDPVLCVERTAFSFDDLPVERRRRTFDAARHHYLFTQDRIDN